MAKLIEEMGEVQQICGKLIQLGGNDVKYWDGTDLRALLHDELGDLAAACRFLIERNGLDVDAIERRASKKFDLMSKWHDTNDTLPKAAK